MVVMHKKSIKKLCKITKIVLSNKNNIYHLQNLL